MTTPTAPGPHAPAADHWSQLRWGRVLRVSLARMLLALAGSLLVWSLVPMVAGWTPRVIMSGSMSPRIQPGDVVVTREIPAASLLPGQVVTVDDPDHAGRTRTHRLLRRDASGRLVLRGDANPHPDSSHVDPAHLRGVGVIRVPFVGRPLFWAAEHNWLALSGFMIATTWCLLSLSSGRRLVDRRTGPPSSPRSTRRRRIAAVAAASLVTGVTATAGPADAAFLTTASNPTSNLSASATFFGYRKAVLADSPTMYWRLGETSGTTAADTSGNGRGGTYSNTPAFRQTGPITSDPSDAALGTGTTGTNGYVTAATSVTTPSAFTIEAWVKTSSATGGQVVGFGNAAAGSFSTTQGIELYIGTDGKVRFGGGTSKTVVASTASIANGVWHHVVGTYSGGGPKGMSLYVDGGTAVQGGATLQSFTGYWRAGAETLSGWTSNPTSTYLNGAVDEVAVYPTVLSSTRIQAHFSAATAP